MCSLIGVLPGERGQEDLKLLTDKGGYDNQTSSKSFHNGNGESPNLEKNLFLLSLMPCPLTVDVNTLIMELLMGILETCYSSTSLTVP